MSYFFLALENLSVPFLYHLREFCLGAGFVRSKPADVTAPESEQLLVTLPSGLRITHSLVLNNLLEPGSLDKYLHVLSRSFSHIRPLWTVSLPPLPLSHTHSTQPQQKALHRGRHFSAERSPGDRAVCQAVPELALRTAFWGQSTFEPEATLAWTETPGGLVSTTVTPCPPLESGRQDSCCPWTPRQPWWSPGPGWGWASER